MSIKKIPSGTQIMKGFVTPSEGYWMSKEYIQRVARLKLEELE